MIEYFPGQKPDEKVLVLVRPHWLVLIWAIIASVVLAVIPIIALIGINAAGGDPFEGAGGAIAAVGIPAYYLILVTWFFIAWLDVYLDIGIVTNDRVVDIDQHGLFSRNVAELDCKVVQDVTADKKGILQTVFNFGSVIIQTAGERPNFEFNGIPRPEEVVDQIRMAVKGTQQEEQQPAEQMKEAAEAIQHAAEKMGEQPPSQPRPSQAPAASAGQDSATPASDTEQDLPREYER